MSHIPGATICVPEIIARDWMSSAQRLGLRIELLDDNKKRDLLQRVSNRIDMTSDEMAAYFTDNFSGTVRTDHYEIWLEVIRDVLTEYSPIKERWWIDIHVGRSDSWISKPKKWLKGETPSAELALLSLWWSFESSRAELIDMKGLLFRCPHDRLQNWPKVFEKLGRVSCLIPLGRLIGTDVSTEFVCGRIDGKYGQFCVFTGPLLSQSNSGDDSYVAFIPTGWFKPQRSEKVFVDWAVQNGYTLIPPSTIMWTPYTNPRRLLKVYSQ